MKEMNNITKCKENTYCVYQHISPANKSYFGIHCNDKVNQRWANGLGYRTQRVFFRAIIKYGWDNFEHKILYRNLSEEEAISKEKELIAKYKTNCCIPGNTNGYNMTNGGEISPSIFYREDENYRKMMQEKVYSKISISVDMCDTQGNLIKTFNSIKEASEAIHCSPGSISRCIKGKQTNAKGYIFKKSDEEIKFLLNKIKYLEREVNQFDFHGNYIQTFKSCAEASRYVNFGYTDGTSIIAKCAKGERASYRGFLWSYNETPVMFKRRRYTRNVPIDMYDKNGNFIKHFESITDGKNFVKPETKGTSVLKKCLDGKIKTAYGYVWKYSKKIQEVIN